MSNDNNATPMADAHSRRKIHGHCTCGALRYTIDTTNIERDLTLAAFCHCSRCQRLNGAPYIWTNHWLYGAVTWQPAANAGSPPGAPGSKSSSSCAPEDDVDNNDDDHFSPAMQTYETMPRRKWKLRCRTCGTPMGSWNAGKGKWTIWPTTLSRKPSARADAPIGLLAEGDFDVPLDVWQQLQARHHQFYGPWRSATLHDGLPKWLGYEGQSTRMTDDGQNQDGATKQ